MKKTIISKLMPGMLIVATGFVFTACSGDEETPESAAEKELTELTNLLFLDDTTHPVFMPTEDDGFYYTNCPSEDMAIKQIEYYTKTPGIVNTSATYRWKDDNGYFKVTPGNDEGLYYEVFMSIKDKTPFTIAFVHPGYENNQNWVVSRPSGGYAGYYRWECGKCLTLAAPGYAYSEPYPEWPPKSPCIVCNAFDWHAKYIPGDERK